MPLIPLGKLLLAVDISVDLSANYTEEKITNPFFAAVPHLYL